jgi:hypothetical protein
MLYLGIQWAANIDISCRAVPVCLLNVGIPSNGITAGNFNVDVLDADGSKNKGVVAQGFAIHAIEKMCFIPIQFSHVRLTITRLAAST